MRNSKGQFSPGTSGNPSGRPKRSDYEREVVAKLCELSDKAVATISSILDDREVSANIRLRAAEVIIDRVCGKALPSDALDDYEGRVDIDFGKLSNLLTGMYQGE